MLATIGAKTAAISSMIFRAFAKAAEKSTQDGDALFQKVNKIIEEKVRPFIKSEGGDIELVDIKNGCMIVSLEGACNSCGHKNHTLYNGVLGAVQDEVPEITNIRQKMAFDDFDI